MANDFVKEFEEMKEMAELRALSAISLEQPLSDEQFRRMKELGAKYLKTVVKNV